MSLQTRLEALITAIGADVKALRAKRASQDLVFTAQGPVETFVGTQRFYPSAAGIVMLSRATLATAGSSNTVVEIKKNDDAYVQLTIPSGQTTVTDSYQVPCSIGDYLTVDVTTAGAGGVNLTVQLRLVQND